MSRDVGLRIEGGRELRRTMRKAGSDLTELKEANRAAADIVTSRARSTAPKVSGNLSNSIRTGATKTAGIVRAGNNRKSATGVPYANPIHWGWPARGITAQPWLSEAATETEPRWIELFNKLVSEALNNVKGI